MSGLNLDVLGQSIEKTRPSFTFNRIMPTITRPHSEGTFIVRFNRARSQQLKVKNLKYVQVKYGMNSVIARLVVDDSMLDDETIQLDQTIRIPLLSLGVARTVGLSFRVYLAFGGRQVGRWTLMPRPVRTEIAADFDTTAVGLIQ